MTLTDANEGKMTPSHEKKLQDWHQNLSPLRVDLVGDFAGKELFAIHGDSLLIHCLAEASVDLTGELDTAPPLGLTQAADNGSTQTASSFFTPSMQSRASSPDSSSADATFTLSGFATMSPCKMPPDMAPPATVVCCGLS